jgi:hypothetical protein
VRNVAACEAIEKSWRGSSALAIDGSAPEERCKTAG